MEVVDGSSGGALVRSKVEVNQTIQETEMEDNPGTLPEDADLEKMKCDIKKEIWICQMK